MAKKIVEVDIPDGLHMGQASDSDGKVGMLFDDKGNLRDHAVFREISTEEDYDTYNYSTETVSNGEIDEETIEAVAAIITFLLVAAPIVYEKASPHIKAFFGEVITPKFVAAKDEVKSKIDNVMGRVKRHRSSGEIVEVKPVIVEFESSRAVATLPAASGSSVVLTEEEAQRILIECFVEYSKIQDKLDLLRSAQIKSNDPSVSSIEGSKIVEFFESPEGIKQLNEALANNHDLLTQHAALFNSTLGHNVLVNGSFHPIELDWLKDSPGDEGEPEPERKK